MEKFSYEWCEELMKSRGYESYGSYQSNRWSKLIGNIQNEESFWIYADIKIEPNNNGIQLSSNTMKYMVSLQTPYIQVDHPEFADFEKKLIDYIESCLQHDVTQEVIKQRRLDRENKKTNNTHG